jgi:outer membrane protein assembly factor BamE (lipoprotein component of BamABCDE complex)
MLKFIRTTFLLIILPIICTSCIKKTQLVGHSVDKKIVESFEKNKTRKAFVQRKLGSPSAKSDFGGETWYYISAEYEQIAFLEKETKEQTVLEILFNEDQTIKDMKFYGKDDAKKISISKDKTKTGGHSGGVLQQLLGNVGRFNSDTQDYSKPSTTRR